MTPPPPPKKYNPPTKIKVSDHSANTFPKLLAPIHTHTHTQAGGGACHDKPKIVRNSKTNYIAFYAEETETSISNVCNSNLYFFIFFSE